MIRRAVPTVVLAPLLIVAIVISSSACGTIANFGGGVRFGPTKNASEPPPLPYGGVIYDVQLVGTDVSWDTKAIIFPLWLVELGASAVLDTITLPAVAWLNAKRLYERAVSETPAMPESYLRPMPSPPPSIDLGSSTNAEEALRVKSRPKK